MTYFIVSFIILMLYNCSVNSPSRLPHYLWTISDISSVIWLWVTLPQGLKIWIPYDYRHTEPPANSDLCRRNAIVSMTQCVFNHITTLIAAVHVQGSCLLSSALGWHLECHRGFPRERHQHHGPQRWPLCGSSRSGAVHHFLPAEQAHAHHPPDHRGALHQPAAQLPAGILWPVSNTSNDRWPLLGHFHVWGSDVSWCGVKCDSEVSAKMEWKYRLFTSVVSQHVREECGKVLKAKLNIF